jgi:hypothetical protein
MNMSDDAIESYRQFIEWRRANRAVRQQQVVQEHEADIEAIKARLDAAEGVKNYG